MDYHGSIRFFQPSSETQPTEFSSYTSPLCVHMRLSPHRRLPCQSTDEA
jgi:hypothetical protein